MDELVVYGDVSPYSRFELPLFLYALDRNLQHFEDLDDLQESWSHIRLLQSVITELYYPRLVD